VGGVTILVIAFSLVGTKRRASWGVVVALFGTLVLLFASSGLLRGLPAGVEARLTSGSTAGQLNGKDQGLANRQPIYVAAFRAAAHMPITGYGINHVAPVEAQAGPNVSWTSLHSIWLWSLLSAGFAGLAFTVLLFFRLLTCASRAWSRARSGVSVALLASVLFLLVDQSKVDAVRLPVYAFFLFAFFGMVASYWRIVQVETTAGSTAEEGT
jgi:O-antigen ligase